MKFQITYRPLLGYYYFRASETSTVIPWPADRITELADLPVEAANQASLNPGKWQDVEGASLPSVLLEIVL